MPFSAFEEQAVRKVAFTISPFPQSSVHFRSNPFFETSKRAVHFVPHTPRSFGLCMYMREPNTVGRSDNDSLLVASQTTKHRMSSPSPDADASGANYERLSYSERSGWLSWRSKEELRLHLKIEKAILRFDLLSFSSTLSFLPFTELNGRSSLSGWFGSTSTPSPPTSCTGWSVTWTTASESRCTTLATSCFLACEVARPLLRKCWLTPCSSSWP